MSVSPVFSSAALGRPFIFSLPSSPLLATEKAPRRTVKKTAEKTVKTAAEILAHLGGLPQIAAAVVPASRLEVRPEPEMVSSGIPQLDLLTGGFARGCLTEICGTASSGRTSILLFALARATTRGEVCALVDASDAFDPASASAAGMEMSRLLWVRCGEKYPPVLQAAEKLSFRRPAPKGASEFKALTAPLKRGPNTKLSFSADSLVDDDRRGPRGKFTKRKNPETKHWESQLAQMLKVTDLLLQSNGFGMIALDLGDVPVQSARRIPLASWFRFRRAVERTPTVLLVLEQQPIAGSCSSVVVKVSGKQLPAVRSRLSGNPPVHSKLPQSELAHSKLLDQFEITAELLCSRLERKPERKPVQSTASFQSRAAWAG